MSDPASGGPSPRYQIVTKLGQGGMARVNLVVSRGAAGVNKLLVAKELHPDLKDDPDLLEMFLDEARLSVRLNHPNVVQTYDVDTGGEHPVIVMEFLEGQSLMALLNRVTRAEMSMDLHLYILTQVLAGLHHAHELCDLDGTPLQVVHRDVSPQNVFITYDGQVKLVDFGIAKASRANRRTRTGVFKGKVTYAAPEQVTGDKVDLRCDIFSFGVMLWEALARRRLVAQELDIVVMQQRANGADPRIETVAPDTPAELVRICNKAMAKNPEGRYASAEELRLDLVAQLGPSVRNGQEQVAALMRTTFGPERSKIRKVIETRIRELGTSNAPPPSTLRPIEEPPVEQTPPSPGRTSVDVDFDVDSADPSGNSTAKVASLTPPLPKPRRGLPVGLVAAVLLVGATVLTIVQIARRKPLDASGLESDARTASSAATAPTATGPSATPTVEVSISVEPPEARVYFDDVEVANNPFHGALPKSGVTRRVRASAPGYTTEEQWMVFDRDVHIQLQLRPAPTGTATASATPLPLTGPRPVGGPATTGAPATAAPASTTRPGDAMPGSTTKSPRSIDDKL